MKQLNKFYLEKIILILKKSLFYVFIVMIAIVLYPEKAKAMNQVPLTGTPVWNSTQGLSGIFLNPSVWYDQAECAATGQHCYVVPTWRERIDYSSGAPADINTDELYIPPPADGAYWMWWHDCDSAVPATDGNGARSVTELNNHCGGKPYSSLKDNGTFYARISYAFSTMNSGGSPLYGLIQGPRIYNPGTTRDYLCLGYGYNPNPGSVFTTIATQTITCKTKTLTICPGMSLPESSGSCPATPTPTPTPVPVITGTLTANPSSGNQPLSSRLTGSVSGGSGTVNYTFWYNCSVNTNSVATASLPQNCGSPYTYGEKHDGLAGTSYTTNYHVFQNPGTYHIKLIIERGGSTPIDLHYDVTVNAVARDTLTVKSVTPSPSSGSAPLLPSLAINYETNHTYGYWDVHVYCSAASSRPDFIHLNIADANVGPASGKSSPWFVGTLNLASNCSYTGSGARQMTILMKASDDPLINGAANPVINLTAVTYSLAVYATGPGSTANIRGVLTSSLPAGTTFRYTMYCDRNDSLNTITSPWQVQTTSTSRDLVLGSCNYAAPGQNYYPKIVVEYPNGTPVVSAKTVYNYTNPMTLAASITANPNPGVINRPVSLSATVTGSATGNINYSFYCKDTDASPAVSFTNVSNTSQSAPNACTYSTAGTFKPKIVVVRSGSTAQAVTSLSIGIPTVTVSLSAIPSTVTPGQSVSLSAQVAGTAEGNIIYDFYCVDTATTYDKRITSTSTNVSADNLCSYPSIGTSRAKVVVSREAKTAQATATVTVSSTGTNGQIIFEENGDPIKIRGSLVANSVVFNARNKGNQTYSARIFSDKNILASRLPGFSDIMNVISSNQ